MTMVSDRPVLGGGESCYVSSDSVIAESGHQFTKLPDSRLLWLTLLDCYQRRDKHRLREVLDGLRAGDTLSQSHRREIWTELGADERETCQAIAGGAE